MSKKAKEVVEAEPKFAQPWQGFLAMSAILAIAYVEYYWFFNPTSGFLTKMVQGNAYILFNWFNYAYPGTASLGIDFALNNPQLMDIYPQGYLVNYISYFVLAIVWFISIYLLSHPFAPLKSRLGKQPWHGLIILVLSMVFAFIQWEIMVIFLKWQAYDLIMLGAIGFAIFPIWALMFNYWPFIPHRPQTHFIIYGATFTAISWIVAFLIRFVAISKIAPGSIETVYSQMYAVGGQWGLGLYVYGLPFTTIQPTEPWDFVASLFFALIVANIMWGIISPFPNMKQPQRGLVIFIIAIITAIVMWGILTLVVGPTNVPELVPTIYTDGLPGLLFMPYYTILWIPTVAHGNVLAFLTFPLITLLFGQFTFGLWPWSRWGIKGRVALVVLGLIIGTILYYIFMVNPGFATTFTGASQISSASGLQSIYLSFWATALSATGAAFPALQQALLWNYTVFAVYFEGINTTVGYSLQYTWNTVVMVFWLLVYEGLENWPFK